MTETTGRERCWCVLAIVRTAIAVLVLLYAMVAMIWAIVTTGGADYERLALPVLAGAAIYGLVRRRPWGRWLALGIAIAALTTGIAAGGLTFAILGGHGVVLLLCLLGPTMARRYELAGAPSAPWQAHGWRAHLLNGAVILGVAAAPVLALWVAPGDTRATVNLSAGFAAALFLAAAVLVARQRAAGLLALVLGALGTGGAIWEGFGGLTDYVNACSGHNASDVARIYAAGALPGLVAGVIALPFIVAALRRR